MKRISIWILMLFAGLLSVAWAQQQVVAPQSDLHKAKHHQVQGLCMAPRPYPFQNTLSNLLHDPLGPRHRSGDQRPGAPHLRLFTYL
jgi:hypothetical protein